MKIFYGGSRLARGTSELPPEVVERLAQDMAEDNHILVGDAAGADAAVQRFLASHGYQNVTIYYSRSEPRVMLDPSWRTHRPANPDDLQGYALQQVKDRAMADDADNGVMLWNPVTYNRFRNVEVSKGTLANCVNLLKAEKPVTLYYAPEDHTYYFDTFASFEAWVHDLPEPPGFDKPTKPKILGRFRESVKQFDELQHSSAEERQQALF